MGCNWIAAEVSSVAAAAAAAALLSDLSTSTTDLFFLTIRQKRGRGGKGKRGEKAIFPAFIFQKCISRIAASDGGEYFFIGWLSSDTRTHSLTHSRAQNVDSSSYINMWVKRLFNFMRTCLHVERFWIPIPAASSPLTFYYFAGVTPRPGRRRWNAIDDSFEMMHIEIKAAVRWRQCDEECWTHLLALR